MKIELDKDITVYVTREAYNDALCFEEEAEYYLTLSDLYECEGCVPHVELKMPEWLELDANVIDIKRLNLN